MSKPDTVHNLVIDSPETKARAKRIIDMLDTSKPWRLDLRVHSESKSDEMRALYHIRCREISRGLDESYSPQQIHERFKETVVQKMMERDDPDYKERLSAYRKLWLEGKKDTAIRLAEIAKRSVSTTWLSDPQWRELLNEQEQFAASMDIHLSEPKPKKEKR